MNVVPEVIGQSAAFSHLLERASQLAEFNRPVLVQGERGSGKELVAARLHYLSPRWQGNYVTLNCAAISESLMDAELFGAEAGAYTGATKSRAGRLEQAHRGTLFLDEVASMPMMMQEKLLRFIEYGESIRLGSNQTRQLDVRVVAASNLDLPALADRGEFRWDLLDRLAFAVLSIPPLRERRGDIMPLAQHFATKWCQENGLAFFAGFSDTVSAQLYAHAWRGNVRELKNVIERSLALMPEPDVSLQTLVLDPFDQAYRPPASLSVKAESAPESEPESPEIDYAPNGDDSIGLKQRMSRFEKQQIEWAMQRHKAIAPSARALGLSYHQLRHLLHKHDLLEKNHSGTI